jgi:hypothetical protein
VLVSSKYDSKEEKTYSPLNPLILKTVHKTLVPWDKGVCDSDAVCYALIEAMFGHEFSSNGGRWDIDHPERIKNSCDNEEEECFECSKKATWDWKDNYSVAEAKLNKTKHEIRMDSYSYYVAGYNASLTAVRRYNTVDIICLSINLLQVMCAYSVVAVMPGAVQFMSA